MPLREIKNYVELCLKGDVTIEERYEIILQQKSRAQAQMEEAQKRLAYMEQKAAIYRETLEKNLPDQMNPAKWTKKNAV